MCVDIVFAGNNGFRGLISNSERWRALVESCVEKTTLVVDLKAKLAEGC